ncbi:MAG: histidine phosphatase family protein [Desulfurococcaceae archaeon]|jgi:phosphohistidine phosphatase|nr:histidine phosphatase family protein [Desulfurococcaceae archaeon]
MLLLFMRHGEAEPKKPGISDDERSLTQDGRAQAIKVAKILDLRPKYVISSPLKRALETAEVVAEALGVKEILQRNELLPEYFDLDSLKYLLSSVGLEDRDIVLLVGHSPSLEDVIQELLGGFRIYLSPGALACLEVKYPDLGSSSLKLYLRPEFIK